MVAEVKKVSKRNALEAGCGSTCVRDDNENWWLSEGVGAREHSDYGQQGEGEESNIGMDARSEWGRDEYWFGMEVYLRGIG